MPEGPEIRLNYDLIKHHLLNQELSQISILSGKYKKKPPTNFNKFKSQLPAIVTKIDVRGKHINFQLDNGWYVWIGFGMTGKLTIDPEEHNHNRMELKINEGVPGQERSLFYRDMRNFGSWFFYKNETDFQKKLNSFGPDILKSEKLTKSEIVKLFRKKNTWEITKALMSQKVLAGTGNYLKAEALYASKIWPYAKVEDLTDSQLYDLFKNLVKLWKDSYQSQKSWIEDGEDRPYSDYQIMMKVYMHDEDPSGNPVKRVTDTKDNRTTHWVPKVQTIGKK